MFQFLPALQEIWAENSSVAMSVFIFASPRVVNVAAVAVNHDHSTNII